MQRATRLDEKGAQQRGVDTADNPLAQGHTRADANRDGDEDDDDGDGNEDEATPLSPATHADLTALRSRRARGGGLGGGGDVLLEEAVALLREEEQGLWLDVGEIMSLQSLRVGTTCPGSRVHTLFRTMGLRRLLGC